MSRRRFGFPILIQTRWVLLAGFGGLLLLLAALGFSSIVVLHKVARVEMDETRRFVTHSTAIHQMRDRLRAIFAVARNSLLDRERADAAARRGRVDQAWSEFQAAVAVVGKAPVLGQDAPLERLVRETAAYRAMVEQTYSWSAPMLDREGYGVLSKELDPQRVLILTALDELVAADEAHLKTAFTAATEEIESLQERLWRTIAIALFLGLGLAAFSVWQVGRLEKVAELRYQALTEAYEEQGRLSQRILDVQELERKSLSRELHDEVSQSLGAMLVDLGSLQEKSPQLDAAKRIGNDVLNEIRNICLLLRPSMLDDLGLIAALHWQARETMRRSGIGVTVTADDVDMDLPDAHRTTVYRVVQEALQNIVRHSGAKQVQIVIRREQQRLTVVVQDDGHGFEPEVTRGLGLLGMQERVNRLEGTLQLVSAPGKGTMLSFILPLEMVVT